MDLCGGGDLGKIKFGPPALRVQKRHDSLVVHLRTSSHDLANIQFHSYFTVRTQFALSSHSVRTQFALSSHLVFLIKRVNRVKDYFHDI